MTQHNLAVETQRKHRRLMFRRVDMGTDRPAGQCVGKASGGGALLALTGEDLMVATRNEYDAWANYGCIEMHYNRLDAAKELSIDLSQLETCNNCGRDAYKTVCVCRILELPQGRRAALLELLLTARDNAITFQEPVEIVPEV